MSTHAPSDSTPKIDRLTDDPQAGNVVLVGVVGTIWLIALIIGTVALYNAVKLDHLDRKVYNVEPGDVRALKDRQLTEMNSPPSWVNEAAGVVRIPIEEAIKLTAEELSAGK